MIVFFFLLSFGVSLGCIKVCLPQGLFEFCALSQRRLIQSLCWQLLWKDGADIFYQTLLEMLTRSSEMRCIDCGQRTWWGWTKEDVLAEVQVEMLGNAFGICQMLSFQALKPRSSNVRPLWIKIGHTQHAYLQDDRFSFHEASDVSFFSLFLHLYVRLICQGSLVRTNSITFPRMPLSVCS